MGSDIDANPLELLESGETIAGLLGVMLDKRDAQLRGETKNLRPLKLNREQKGKLGSIMSAFGNANYSDEQLWADIQYVATRHRLFDVQPSSKRRLDDPSWLDAKLVFHGPAEDSIREWLGRPLEDPNEIEWQEALAQCSGRFECSLETLTVPALPPGFSGYLDLIRCWIKVGDILRNVQVISWRQLAARCFHGDSKFLDSSGQQSFLRRLYPSLSSKLLDRPVLLHLVLPELVEQVMLIENQDTFLCLADAPPANTAVVYSEGYRAGATRIREAGIAQFSVFNPQACGDLSQFKQWWLGAEHRDWATFFWGDLDYAGMDIAASLRASFGGLECWQPGYGPMLEYLLQGGGHLASQADKEEQRLANREDRCPYSAQKLIPALDQCSRFVDQEWLPVAEID